MTRNRWRDLLFSDLGILILLALSRIILHALTNHNYGFHRDELAFLDNARHLDWGYVAYPPLTPFIGRIAMALFGPSLVGVRFFSGLAQGAALVLSGLIARELGGKRWAVLVTGLAVWIAPVSIAQGRVVPVCFLRLLVVGADRLLRGAPGEIGRPALVAGDRRGGGIGHDDQIHHGLLRGGAGRRGAADPLAPLPEEPLAVGRGRAGAAHLFTQPDLANPA